MKSFSKKLFLVIIAGCFFSSCLKKTEYPVEPIIKYVDFIPSGDSARFIFSFTDGDGDIGLLQSDTVAPYDYNMFLKYFEKENGVFVEIPTAVPFNYRIPVITPEGQNKTLEGEIAIRINFYYNPFSAFDTIKYSAYIMDRALNKSNTIETREIIVNK